MDAKKTKSRNRLYSFRASASVKGDWRKDGQRRVSRTNKIRVEKGELAKLDKIGMGIGTCIDVPDAVMLPVHPGNKEQDEYRGKTSIPHPKGALAIGFPKPPVTKVVIKKEKGARDPSNGIGRLALELVPSSRNACNDEVSAFALQMREGLYFSKRFVGFFPTKDKELASVSVISNLSSNLRKKCPVCLDFRLMNKKENGTIGFWTRPRLRVLTPATSGSKLALMLESWGKSASSRKIQSSHRFPTATLLRLHSQSKTLTVVYANKTTKGLCGTSVPPEVMGDHWSDASGEFNS
ncbi:hypothetical protein HAX54_022274 [Datura stramonium]|uniref:Uncharacterized protein n=1 Tax=Datura stramonium TaxID=4076 RepID=A0ABS8S6G8_DATST|nr:hypothetical protein [Datura stramonium]